MVMNWAKLTSFKDDKDTSQMIVLSILITANTSGLLSTWYLLLARKLREFWQRCKFSKHNLTTNKGDDKETVTVKVSNEKGRGTNMIFKVKLCSLYLFGFGYLFHCGLYAWKHFCLTKDLIHGLGFGYNILSIVYIFFLLIFFSSHLETNEEKSGWKRFLFLVILVSNVCIWLDTFFSESNALFEETEDQRNQNNSKHIKASHSIDNSSCNSTILADEAIEKTDAFFSPAMIEFALMSIDLLFTKESCYPKEDKKNMSQIKKNARFPANCMPCLICLGLLCSFACFGLFAFTFTVILTEPKDEDFEVYIIFQLSLKCIIGTLTVICIISVCSFRQLSFHFNVEAFVLIFSCFGNIVYHMFSFFAYWSSKWDAPKEDKTLSLIENIISILIAGFQIYFVLGMHSSSNNKSDPVSFYGDSGSSYSRNDLLGSISSDSTPPSNELDAFNLGFSTASDESGKYNCQKRAVFFMCLPLSMINFGIWISDSVGEGRLQIFSVNLHHAYNKQVWLVLNKLILPLTIFFRFNMGLEFLKLFFERYTFFGDEKNLKI